MSMNGARLVIIIFVCFGIIFLAAGMLVTMFFIDAGAVIEIYFPWNDQKTKLRLGPRFIICGIVWLLLGLICACTTNANSKKTDSCNRTIRTSNTNSEYKEDCYIQLEKVDLNRNGENILPGAENQLMLSSESPPKYNFEEDPESPPPRYSELNLAQINTTDDKETTNASITVLISNELDS